MWLSPSARFLLCPQKEILTILDILWMPSWLSVKDFWFETSGDHITTDGYYSRWGAYTFQAARSGEKSRKVTAGRSTDPLSEAAERLWMPAGEGSVLLAGLEFLPVWGCVCGQFLRRVVSLHAFDQMQISRWTVPRWAILAHPIVEEDLKRLKAFPLVRTRAVWWQGRWSGWAVLCTQDLANTALVVRV